MQVDGTRADGAAAGQRDARVAEARHQRPQRQDRGAHRLHQFVRRFGVGDVLRLDREIRSAAGPGFPRAHRMCASSLAIVMMSRTRGIFFRYDGSAVSSAAAIAGKRRVLRAADAYRAFSLRPP